MLNKLQAIIKNVIIEVYCLTWSSVGVPVLRAGRASVKQKEGRDPKRGSTCFPSLVTPSGSWWQWELRTLLRQVSGQVH